MGPPTQSPSAFFSRYLIARVTSEYLVHMPTRADIHIQKTAPGPPMAIAPDTPAMLPVPMDAARAVHMALKGDTEPFAAGPSCFFRALPKVFLKM